MGLKNLEKISQGLLDNGREKSTPVAVINWGTMSKQKTVVGNLENISKLARNEKLKSPCLIVVGEVVNLRNKLNFFEEMPLFGENIVLTREVKNVHSTKEKFHRLGANVITLPMIETVELETQREIFDNINNYDYIFFTSVNGVNYFFKQFLKSYDIRDLKDIKFCALGIKTKKAIENFGIKVDIMPENYAGEDGVKALEKVLKKTDKLLVPRAKMGRPEIIDSLKDLAEITEIQIYDTKSLSAEIEETLEEYERYSLVFTSASTFNNFYKGIKDRNRIFSRAKIISIGPITSIAIKKAGLNVDIEAKEYTIEGIIEGILEEKNV